MIVLIVVAIIAFVIIFIVGLVEVTSEYGFHEREVKRNSDKYGYATFDIFMEKFNEVNFKRGGLLGDKWHCHRTNSEIKGHFIEFNGIGMIMSNVVEYSKLYLFLRTLEKEYKKSQEHNWYNNKGDE